VFLIVGLGNPEPKYEITRHNAGFLAVDTLAEKHKIILDRHRFNSLCGEGTIDGIEVMIMKPMTYMNESGLAVKAVVSSLNLRPEQIIVAHDEIDLLPGKIKVKLGGGDAGQRGIRSIIAKLGTKNFTRIRIGIGRPEYQGQIVNYVLSPFSEEELKELDPILERSAILIENKLKELNERDNQTEENVE
jgi:PTH1 family peptidyl-tRNA hydrolase